MIGSVTKWAARAMPPAEVPGLVREAFQQLSTGRQRPVEIEIPPDVLMGTADVELAEPGTDPLIEGDPNALERAARLLGAAEGSRDLPHCSWPTAIFADYFLGYSAGFI